MTVATLNDLKVKPRNCPKAQWLESPVEYARVEWVCRICTHPIEFGQPYHRSNPTSNAARAHKKCVERLKK